MIRPLLWLALAAAGATAASAAPADDQRATPEELRMLHDFTRCVAGQSEGQARRVLGMDYRTGAYRRSLRNLAVEARACRPFGFDFRMSGVLYAGSLAEALLPKALAGSTLVSRAAVDPSRPAIPARDEGEYLGLCAVRMMPDRVAALLATAPGSAEEKDAAAAVSRDLGPCLKAGVSAKLNRPGLRALLALAAYRIVTQAQPASAGS